MLKKAIDKGRDLPVILDRFRVLFNAWYLRRKGITLGAYPWISGRIDLYLAGQLSLVVGDRVFIPRTIVVMGNDDGP